MPTLTIRTVRSRFPHTRPGLARRGLGQEATQASPWTVVNPLGFLTVVPDFWANATTGLPSENQLATLKQQRDAALLQASTDPVTGSVDTLLLQQQIAAADADVANVIGQAAKTSTGSTVADLFDSLQGSGPYSLPSGTDWAKGLGVVANILIIGGVVVGGYYLYKAVR